MTLSSQSDRMTFARILATWAAQADRDRAPRGRLATRLDKFRRCPPANITSMLGGQGSGVWDLGDSLLWIHGPYIRTGTPPLTPIATVRVSLTSFGVLEACIRVALFFENEDAMDWVGWRFETADAKEGPHPYPHAQHIGEWRKGFEIDGVSSELFGGDEGSLDRKGMNERRPAFPLRGGRTISGLAIVMVAALHGAPDTRRWFQLLSRDSGVADEVRNDIGAILG